MTPFIPPNALGETAIVVKRVEGFTNPANGQPVPSTVGLSLAGAYADKLSAQFPQGLAFASIAENVQTTPPLTITPKKIGQNVSLELQCGRIFIYNPNDYSENYFAQKTYDIRLTVQETP